jgi:predicted ribosome quality control (RQC) complex YloA/Tae2 family protein
MLTDWLLIRRAARELNDRLCGSRVRDVGALPDGRLALALWKRGETQLLCVDIFGSPPSVTLENEALPIASEVGFVRALGAALRGTILATVSSRTGDRLLQLDFSVRSRFGVEVVSSLILELVPRFGNAVLLRNGGVVAAMREFSPADNATRSILVGHPYEFPPLATSLAIPKLIARDYDEAQGGAIVARYGAPGTPLEPLFVYRRGSNLVQAHLVALPSLGDADLTRENSLLELFAEARRADIDRGLAEGAQRRRAALTKQLSTRERKLRAQLAALAEQRVRIAERADLRARGETIFATLHELDARAAEDAKTDAAKLFAKYRKLGTAIPHVVKREAAVRAWLDATVELQWEVERAGEADLADVAQAIAALDPRSQRSTQERSVRRKRALLEWRTPSGSRIVLGRTPLENAEVTFRVARPNDLWFHVQGQPGAHVVLQRDDRTDPPEEDVLYAASLAALHSKAKASQKVAVDYTQRKHVRKRPASAPGLVFYTNPKTVSVSPSAPTVNRS